MRQFLSLLAFIVFSLTGYSQGFTVTDYNVEIHINGEGYFDVIEKYNLDFSQEKHGIYRDIPLEYDFVSEAGEKFKRKIIISDVKVPNWKFTSPSNIFNRYSDEFRIKIGDANKVVSGPQYYEIRYRVENAFIFTDDMVQFYWNLKPWNWEADFPVVNFKIYVPGGAELSPENCFVYAGGRGVTTPSQEFDYEYSKGMFAGQSHTGFVSYHGQSVTALIKLPKHLIKEINYDKPWWMEYSWLGILGLFWLGFRKIWDGLGRNKKVVPITSYYPPDNMDSALAGYLIDDSADTQDLVSLLPKWAIQGIIHITEIPKKGLFGSKDMELKRLGNLPDLAATYETEIFNSLFSDGDTVLISDLKDSFYTTMSSAKKKLAGAAKRKFYDTSANSSRQKIGCVAILAAIAVGFIFFVVWGILAGLVSVVFFIAMAVGFFKMKKNIKGDDAFAELLGFRQFIKLAEVNRIKVLLEDDPKYFEKTMSYAVAFGLLKEWAKKFDDLNVEPPEWYSGSSMGSMSSFGNSLSSGLASAQSTMVSSPSSSSSGGGGSSGGGFGGGGGGSW